MSGIDRLPCPDCAEMVMRAARVCPLCGHEFSEIEQQLRTQGVGLLKLPARGVSSPRRPGPVPREVPVCRSAQCAPRVVEALGDISIPAGWGAAVQPSPLHSRFPGVGDGRTHWRLVVRFTVPNPRPRRPDVDRDAHIEWTGCTARPFNPWTVRSFAVAGTVAYAASAQAAIDLVAASIGGSS